MQNPDSYREEIFTSFFASLKSKGSDASTDPTLQQIFKNDIAPLLSTPTCARWWNEADPDPAVVLPWMREYNRDKQREMLLVDWHDQQSPTEPVTRTATPLVTPAGYRPILSPITASLSSWLEKHLLDDNAAVLDWVLESGGILHPEVQPWFQRSLTNTIKQGALSDKQKEMLKIWHLLLQQELLNPPGGWGWDQRCQYATTLFLDNDAASLPAEEGNSLLATLFTPFLKVQRYGFTEAQKKAEEWVAQFTENKKEIAEGVIKNRWGNLFSLQVGQVYWLDDIFAKLRVGDGARLAGFAPHAVGLVERLRRLLLAIRGREGKYVQLRRLQPPLRYDNSDDERDMFLSLRRSYDWEIIIELAAESLAAVTTIEDFQRLAATYLTLYDAERFTPPLALVLYAVRESKAGSLSERLTVLRGHYETLWQGRDPAPQLLPGILQKQEFSPDKETKAFVTGLSKILAKKKKLEVFEAHWVNILRYKGFFFTAKLHRMANATLTERKQQLKEWKEKNERPPVDDLGTNTDLWIQAFRDFIVGYQDPWQALQFEETQKFAHVNAWGSLAKREDSPSLEIIDHLGKNEQLLAMRILLGYEIALTPENLPKIINLATHWPAWAWPELSRLLCGTLRKDIKLLAGIEKDTFNKLYEKVAKHGFAKQGDVDFSTLDDDYRGYNTAINDAVGEWTELWIRYNWQVLINAGRVDKPGEGDENFSAMLDNLRVAANTNKKEYLFWAVCARFLFELWYFLPEWTKNTVFPKMQGKKAGALWQAFTYGGRIPSDAMLLADKGFLKAFMRSMRGPKDNEDRQTDYLAEAAALCWLETKEKTIRDAAAENLLHASKRQANSIAHLLYRRIQEKDGNKGVELLEIVAQNKKSGEHGLFSNTTIMVPLLMQLYQDAEAKEDIIKLLQYVGEPQRHGWLKKIFEDILEKIPEELSEQDARFWIGLTHAVAFYHFNATTNDTEAAKVLGKILEKLRAHTTDELNALEHFYNTNKPLNIPKA